MTQSCGVEHCTRILRLRPHGWLDLGSAIIKRTNNDTESLRIKIRLITRLRCDDASAVVTSFAHQPDSLSMHTHDLWLITIVAVIIPWCNLHRAEIDVPMSCCTWPKVAALHSFTHSNRLSFWGSGRGSSPENGHFFKWSLNHF